MALITCKDLSVSYDGKPVLQSLDLTVEVGNYLCIVGENGSGKSTLVKTLLGLVRPQHGQVIFGDGLTQRQIGYLPQQGPVQRDFPASVFEVVLSGCLNGCGFNPFYTRAQKQQARTHLARLGIADLADRCYRELSGGQQQRVLLARALCATQRLILLDEPVAGLDPRVTQDMYQLIAELNRKDGITVIMVSHDLAGALRHASHILHLGGDARFFGTRDDYLASPIAQAFLGGETHA